MKVLLATSIYPPDIGGPSIYAKKLKQGLEDKGIEVEVCSYHGLSKYPQPLKIWIYAFRLLKKIKGVDVIYSFNLISCGLPALKIAKIFRKKFFIRLGGDFLWERAVEQGRTKMPLRKYYKETKTIKEKFWLFIIKAILSRTDKIIFTTDFQKQIYQKQFHIKEEKIVIIPNPFPETKADLSSSKFQVPCFRILYAGRLIKLKNINTLIKVARLLSSKFQVPRFKLLIIGEGPEEEKLRALVKKLGLTKIVIFEKPLSHQDLMQKINRSDLCILPSLTEISPNFALECIALGKPIILTKETGIYEQFKNDLIFIDPKNPKDLENKIIELFDKKNYQRYAEKIAKIKINWNWNNVIEKHIINI